MMSLNHGSLNLGQAVGTSLGGVLLLRYNYGMLGFGLGLLGLVAVLIFYFWVIDPTDEAPDDALLPTPVIH
jgi:predicted MFS family arabinose efflux permease